MSLSLIAFQPAMDEPSNMMPSRNASSPMVETCWAVCCHLPRGIGEPQVHVLHGIVAEHLEHLGHVAARSADATVAGFFAIYISPFVCPSAAGFPPVTGRGGCSSEEPRTTRDSKTRPVYADAPRAGSGIKSECLSGLPGPAGAVWKRRAGCWSPRSRPPHVRRYESGSLLRSTR